MTHILSTGQKLKKTHFATITKLQAMTRVSRFMPLLDIPERARRVRKRQHALQIAGHMIFSHT